MNKIVFEEFFNKSQGKPFIYKGKEIKMSDRVLLPKNKALLRLVFVSTDSQWRQGIIFQTKGEFEVNGQKLPNKVVLWENTAPREVEISLTSKDKILFIYNVWDTGDGTMHYGHNGGALFIEQNDKVTTYNCNDGYADDDFNDLIFRIEFV
ncbi:hypothetical protein [Mucilaginibacter panaciglaebae]|uniref:Uncharacterized protein n=1 Tax=Mucilaginibacter panaciglaebae TaxID=502331 RepID=A0ABP7X688_9SPHI